MYRLLNKVVKRRHSLLVDYDQLSLTISCLSSLDIFQITTGNCGWAKAPNCYFVNFTISDEKWYNLLDEFKKEGVVLLPETTGR